MNNEFPAILRMKFYLPVLNVLRVFRLELFGILHCLMQALRERQQPREQQMPLHSCKTAEMLILSL